MILIQLISNGLKFSKPNQAVSISLSLESNNLIIQVADEGCGIKEHEKEHVFGAFIKVNTVKRLVFKAVV